MIIGGHPVSVDGVGLQRTEVCNLSINCTLRVETRWTEAGRKTGAALVRGGGHPIFIIADNERRQRATKSKGRGSAAATVRSRQPGTVDVTALPKFRSGCFWQQPRIHRWEPDRDGTPFHAASTHTHTHTHRVRQSERVSQSEKDMTRSISSSQPGKIQKYKTRRDQDAAVEEAGSGRYSIITRTAPKEENPIGKRLHHLEIRFFFPRSGGRIPPHGPRGWWAEKGISV